MEQLPKPLAAVMAKAPSAIQVLYLGLLKAPRRVGSEERQILRAWFNEIEPILAMAGTAESRPVCRDQSVQTTSTFTHHGREEPRQSGVDAERLPEGNTSEGTKKSLAKSSDTDFVTSSSDGLPEGNTSEEDSTSSSQANGAAEIGEQHIEMSNGDGLPGGKTSEEELTLIPSSQANGIEGVAEQP